VGGIPEVSLGLADIKRPVLTVPIYPARKDGWLDFERLAHLFTEVTRYDQRPNREVLHLNLNPQSPPNDSEP